MVGGVRAALGSGAWAGVAWRAAPAARAYCSSLGTSTCQGRADGLEEGAPGGPGMPCPPLLLGSQTEELQAEEALSLFCKNLTPSDDWGTVEVALCLRRDLVRRGGVSLEEEL